MSKSGLLILSAVGVICLFVLGCGEKLPDDMPKLYPASIEITLDGAPLKKAIVTLTPASPTAGQPAFPVAGVTDDNGVATLQTNGRYKGSPAGKYKVCVSKRAAVEGPTSKMTPPTDPDALLRYNRRVEDERNFINAIDDEYSDAKKTVLEIEIKEGRNSETFEVKKKPNSPDFFEE